MTITGEIMNGTFVPDYPLEFANGTKVRLETDDPLNLTEEESLARLRVSIEESRNGMTYDALEVMRDMANRHSISMPGDQ